ncbi:FecR family protein [Leptothoe kymatousa]|uniref:FecR domain-containing protein n=1 Tax=Leptothoe kymatousa TAU-MAC 1615 TaxID=2364775 RepID=A0ABS5Y4C9_9CYAN|nr:FecR family protein [Leptothoe kymatousa]MBT9312358.1 FecR domain-containing protein [Leptothoe kymatousa TAU-MAC 1615]
MNIGDALRTSSSARAELRFNDGSLARVGEQATFRFTPDTRNFQLSNGTVLLLIPPGHGRTTIQTPNAVTGIQGSALFVRVRCTVALSADGSCSAPVTIVGALTNNPAGAMMAFNETGSQQQPIYAGEMVVIEENNIVESLEFDLRTFYETSGLVEGLGLDHPTAPETLPQELREVWTEIQDALELQGDFDSQGSSEEIVSNPGFLAPAPALANGESTELDDAELVVFNGFPTFASSPAAIFHNAITQVATGQSTRTYTSPTAIEQGGTNAAGIDLADPVTNARASETTGASNSAAAISTGPVSQPSPAATTQVVSPAATPTVANTTPTAPTAAAPTTTPTVANTPTVPTVADTPTVPTVANTPTVPTVADAPTVPTVADAPTVPTVADTPTVPTVADTPTVPTVADTPTIPTVADTPTVPTVADTPTVAETPTVPTTVPDTPTVPTVADTPVRNPASADDFNLNVPGANTPTDLPPTTDVSQVTGGGEDSVPSLTGN